MKKSLNRLLKLGFLAGALAALTVAASAVEFEGKGICNVSAIAKGYTVEFRTADGEKAPEQTDVTVGGKLTTVYENAEKIQVTYDPQQASGEQLLLITRETEESKVPTVNSNSVFYIDQKTAGGVSDPGFLAYPRAMSKETYAIWLTSSAGAVKVATFDYTMPYTLGKVNDDDEINAADALLILQHFVGDVTLNATQQKAAEVTGDGEINANDALQILQFFVGDITRFPIETKQG